MRVDFLEDQGFVVNRKRVQRLMRKMGVEGMSPRRRTTLRNAGHQVYPYLLRDLKIERPNQVWCSDITYIPMRHGFMYLVAVLDCYSRLVLSWRLSNSRCDSQDQQLLYRVAVQTGLRSSELRSLRRGGFHFADAAHYVKVESRSTKNKQVARHYVDESLANDLRSHLATKTPKAPAFTLPSAYDMAEMLRTDVDTARALWLRDSKDADERAEREESLFLTPEIEAGETLDFHALRHTCGAWLVMWGGSAENHSNRDARQFDHPDEGHLRAFDRGSWGRGGCRQCRHDGGSRHLDGDRHRWRVCPICVPTGCCEVRARCERVRRKAHNHPPSF